MTCHLKIVDSNTNRIYVSTGFFFFYTKIFFHLKLQNVFEPHLLEWLALPNSEVYATDTS
jgi:hypothetical protein